MALTSQSSITSTNIWSPLKLWVLAVLLLVVAAFSFLLNLSDNISLILALGSFLLFAAGNPILNAIKEGLLQNLMWSLPLFVVHAILTYSLLNLIGSENEIAMKRVFSTIVIFYIMATVLSIFFRAIYQYISEN